jgi:hypothetical protein
MLWLGDRQEDFLPQPKNPLPLRVEPETLWLLLGHLNHQAEGLFSFFVMDCCWFLGDFELGCKVEGVGRRKSVKKKECAQMLHNAKTEVT